MSFFRLGPHVLSGSRSGLVSRVGGCSLEGVGTRVDVRMGDRVGRFRGNASRGLVIRLVADCQGRFHGVLGGFK